MSAAHEGTIIYGNTSPAYLASHLFPGATRIRANIGEDAGELLERLPFMPERFLFNVALTDLRNVPLRRGELVARLRERGAWVINEGVTDVSKRAVQDHCERIGLPTTRATREGSPDELVVVKTDWNCAGSGENLLDHEQRARIGLSDTPTAAWTPDYPVIPRREVAEEVWASADFFVERYVANAGDVCYRTYRFGDRLVVSRAVDAEPLKRMPEGIPREDFFFSLTGGDPVLVEADGDDTPLELAREVAHFCRTLRLDYGALDVVLDDEGRHYIVDVNNTPVWGDTGHLDIVEFLAAGSR